MQYYKKLFVRLADNLVHIGCLGFFRSISDIQYSDGDGLGAECHSDQIADLYGIRRLGALSVYGYALTVTGIVGNGAPLDESGYLEIFIKAHNYSLIRLLSTLDAEKDAFLLASMVIVSPVWGL